ncbi:NmrA/HSCARG family protein [Chitinophagaceae bacterium LB-8]|uniref:NmrA/HSCARG family protein n=1 Tax=Paraflavisolibacter caeni TaxID=2982496 RepID=A0A9X2XSQ2_9BACT|nr:NmrA/HSCARG family protein [Paraflavisolibacter caeni]MCU7547562.1 NmrA/HSCARG family protein [Paraflavisolibacter caeni]
MPSKKIITIFGSTGAQGGGLARAILNDPNSEFAVRASTRNVNSDKARELAQMGAELVTADIDVPSTVHKALEGAYGAYFVTFYWAHFSPEKEAAEAKIMAEAAKATGLQHVIWSTLEDTREYVPLENDHMPTLKGIYKVPHFDAKGESDKCFIDMGVPATFLRASFYWENMIYFGMGPKKELDGNYSITFPIGDKKMAGIAAEDIGKCAYGIFKRGQEMIGKLIGVAGDQLTGQEMAAKLSKALSKGIRFNSVSPETYRGFGFPGADDLGNMFQFYRDFEQELNKVRDVTFSRQLNPELQSFDQWLAKNAQRIPLE